MRYSKVGTSTPADRSSAPTPTPKRKARRTQAERSQKTRAKLLAAACKLLVKRGYGQVSVDHISTTAGLTSGARVHHFKNKRELMVALWEHLREKTDQAAIRAVAETDPSYIPLDLFLDRNFRILRGHEAIAFYELMNGARVDKAFGRRIHGLAKAHRDKFESVWLELLSRQGYEAKEAIWIVRTTICLMRGLVSDPFMGTSPTLLKEAMQFWRDRIGGPIARQDKRPGADPDPR